MEHLNKHLENLHYPYNSVKLIKISKHYTNSDSLMNLSSLKKKSVKLSKTNPSGRRYRKLNPISYAKLMKIRQKLYFFTE